MSDPRLSKETLKEKSAKRKAHAKWLAAENEKLDDWQTHCRGCGRVRLGTLAYLRKPCESCGHGA